MQVAVEGGGHGECRGPRRIAADRIVQEDARPDEPRSPQGDEQRSPGRLPSALSQRAGQGQREDDHEHPGQKEIGLLYPAEPAAQFQRTARMTDRVIAVADGSLDEENEHEQRSGDHTAQQTDLFEHDVPPGNRR